MNKKESIDKIFDDKAKEILESIKESYMAFVNDLKRTIGINMPLDVVKVILNKGYVFEDMFISDKLELNCSLNLAITPLRYRLQRNIKLEYGKKYRILVLIEKLKE